MLKSDIQRWVSLSALAFPAVRLNPENSIHVPAQIIVWGWGLNPEHTWAEHYFEQQLGEVCCVCRVLQWMLDLIKVKHLSCDAKTVNLKND